MEPLTIVARQLRDIARDAIALIPQLIAALVIVLLTFLIAKLASAVVGRLAERARLRPSLVELFKLLATILIWLIGIMIAAVVVFPNLTPASVLAGLGIGSVAIGFAFKDIFENFFAGIMILFRKEMRIGDFVETEGGEGKVTKITIRETHIRQTDGQLVIVPNATLFKNPLTIRTDLEERRVTVIAGVAYGEDVDESRAVIRRAVEACDSVITDRREVEIFAQAFGSSSIDFEVTWWTGSTPLEVRRSRDEVVAAVKRGLDEAGIEIPFPYRTLTFKEPLQVTDGGRRDGGERDAG